ncbi:hypothetical protein [Acinetobacter sp.]|uniref:hypothetical protein n=1 Tax=Acinetobacter sp. TaxID=472 RepID=UPI0028AC51FF|nr:hypothetical protein [Acinetobacter sp.]
MKKINFFAIIFISNAFVFNVFAKSNNSWNDIDQDSIQVSKPIEYIDSYNKYSMINAKLKVKLVDYGNIEKNKKNIRYTLKNYGVEVFNNLSVYRVFKSTAALKSEVDFNLLYSDRDIFAFRIRKNSTIDYVEFPYKNYSVETYVYDIKSNNYVLIDVLNSDSNTVEGKTDLLQGDQFTFNTKTGNYTYLANIKYAGKNKIGIFKVNLNKKLKCLSSTLGCGNIGFQTAELISKN